MSTTQKGRERTSMPWPVALAVIAFGIIGTLSGLASAFTWAEVVAR